MELLHPSGHKNLTVHVIVASCLSSREREVLQMIAEGKTNKEVATALNLSVYTIDAHRGKIMEKLNLHYSVCS